jgi:hypothetical protein
MSPWAATAPHDPPIVPPPTTTSAAAIDPQKLQVGYEDQQADMASVLDKLQQVRSMDPAAEQKLLEELRRTPPNSWPLVAEQFRASLAYREKVASKGRRGNRDSETPPDILAQTSRAHGSPDYGKLGQSEREDDRVADLRLPESVDRQVGRPSAPIGSLVDPRGAIPDVAALLSRSTPYAMPSPIVDGVTLPAATAPSAPAEFVADARSYPISADPGGQQSTVTTAAATETAKNGTGVVQAKLDVTDGAADVSTGASAGASAPGTPSQGDDWQELVKMAAADLSEQAAKSPSTTAEIHQHVSLRILRLLEGDTEKALEPIPGISPAEQDHWSRQLFALATYLDHHTQPDDKRRAAASVTHLDEAVSHLREIGSLSVRNLTFCKNVYGYGAVEPYEADRFTPGQQVSLYVEIENYHSKSTEKGYCTSLGSSYELLDEKGTRVAGGEFPDVDDCCRTRRRDFHIQYTLSLPEKLEAGRYRLQVVVKDRQSDKLGNATAAFQIGAK